MPSCLLGAHSTSSDGGNENALSHLSLQMALWLPSNNKVYLPPTSVSKVVATDEYVQRTPYYYHASTSRLLTVGHPFFPILDQYNVEKVPKVSSNQYRVFRISLPDPNKFGLPDSDLYDPEKERLVWACTGIEVGRGQPLGIGLSGHPLFNRFDDTENPGKYNTTFPGTDNRQNVSMDNKQTQMFMLGCTPPLGEHWGKALRCESDPPAQAGDCPPIELVTSVIEDGDMIDTGFGNMDFRTLQENKSDVPLDISQSVCKYPDYLKMTSDPHGNSLFFLIRREQMFTRHFFSRAGVVGEQVPDSLLFKADVGQNQNTLSTSVYTPTPSGSLVSSDTQIFNRPYWLSRAQGNNNGICWDNQLFLTVVDTTRSTNFTLSIATQSNATYNAANFKQYMRHVEEFDLQFIFQLCKVSLTPEVLAYLHTMDPDVLDNWNLGLSLPTAASVEDTYRFITSSATRCPDRVPPKDKVDPYAKHTFWTVDLTNKFSTELDQFPLGRKFLQQTGLRTRSALRTKSAAKRPAPTAQSTTVKRRRR
uniref:Major capsid protein L1 n=1 Tax=Sus scrofa papillomavirus 1 TaxID=446138 RepID=A0A7T3P0M1_9PAPI|nr:L1 [Sus scrofa papillomavirus 1]